MTTNESDRAPEAVDLDAWRAEAGACAPLDAAASPAWVQAHHIDEPRAIVSADDMTRSLLALDRDGMAIFDRVEDARFAVAARDGWPRDAARVGVLCAEVERLSAEVARERGRADEVLCDDTSLANTAQRLHAEVATLRAALLDAADGWDAARKSATPPRRADAETIARLRAIAAGSAPAKEPTR